MLAGVLVPSFDAASILVTDAIGTATLSLPWFPLPPGLGVWMQAGILDPQNPQGLAFRNAVRLHHP